MPLTVPPNTDFTGASVTEAIYKARLEALLNELRDNGAALSDVRGFKNRIINGGFSINQRGLTTAADGVYHLDRWYALSDTGSVTIAQQSDQENGTPTSLRMTQPDASAKRIGSAQAIESSNCRDLRSAAAMLSARVRCSVSQAIRYAVLEHTGTVDTITRDVVNNWSSGSYTAGGFFIAGVNVLAVGSVTPAANTWTAVTLGVTVGATAQNLIVFFWVEGALAQNATLDLGRVQLEAGAVFTAFERRPIDLTLASCKRYYEAGFQRFSGNVTSGSAYIAQSQFKVIKRVAPTLAFTNVSNTNFPSTPGFTGGGVDYVEETRTANGTGAGGFSCTYTASAEL